MSERRERASTANPGASRPSAELRALGAEALEIARRRGSRPGRLVRRLRGALDRAVHRATSGPRGRRQDSVAALAREIAREVDRYAAGQRARGVLAIAAAAAGAGILAAVLAGLSWMA